MIGGAGRIVTDGSLMRVVRPIRTAAATVLAIAVPTIDSDLGGYTQFPWLFSAYLLTRAATVPIYGRL